MRMCSVVLMFIFLIKYAFATSLIWNALNKEFFEGEGFDTTAQIMYISLSVIQGIVFLISVTVPDLLMVIIARVYFTECHLYADAFVNEMKEMKMDDISDSALCRKYIEMHHKIKGYFGYFHIWILNLCLQMVLSSWHSVSTYLHPNDANTEIWIIYSSMEAVIYFITTLFVLWPVFLLTERLHTLNEMINEKLNKVYETRLHFHDDSLSICFVH